MTVGEGRCADCSAPAVVCSECVRAIALQWFGAIARHPESGTTCALCEHGHAAWCGDCFITEMTAYRTTLRHAGARIGEPSRWPP